MYYSFPWNLKNFAFTINLTINNFLKLQFAIYINIFYWKIEKKTEEQN